VHCNEKLNIVILRCVEWWSCWHGHLEVNHEIEAMLVQTNNLRKLLISQLVLLSFIADVQSH
jgi:hypothetical protein